MKITTIGTGYVGLVTGTCFSTTGHDVTCVDVDQNKIGQLKRGQIPIFEPGLEELVSESVSRGCLDFTTNVAAAVRGADVVFLAVGTPQAADGSADLSQLVAAAEMISTHLRDDSIVVIKSTVPVGTNKKISDHLERLCGRTVEVVSNPEFLKEGTAIDDCLSPDRVVVGVRGQEAAHVLEQLYEPYVDAEHPLLVMSPESAEMTKYVANSLLALKISFINEMANISELVQADIDEVCQGIGHDRRIGFEFLRAGVGYGGSCFPKDVRALTAQSRDKGYEPLTLKATDDANEFQKTVLISKIKAHFGNELRNKRITLWGLAFKPGTDDIREAPSLVLIDWLLAKGAEVCVHDPQAIDNVRAIYGDRLEYFDNHWDALQLADALAVLTDWPQYCGADAGQLRWYLRRPVIFDGRNCLNLEQLRYGDFQYYGVGRGDEVSNAKPNGCGIAEDSDSKFAVPLVA